MSKYAEDIVEIKIATAVLQEQMAAQHEQVGALVAAYNEAHKRGQERLDKLETTKWKQWLAIVLISAGVNLPPWLSGLV